MTTTKLKTTKGTFEVAFFHVRNRQEIPEEFDYTFTPEELDANQMLYVDYTVAYTFTNDNKAVYSSRSIRHPHDRFERKRGRDQAIDRLKAHIEETKRYDSHFDGCFEVPDMVLDRHAALREVLSMFKPNSAEAILRSIAENFIADNLSGDFVIESLTSHYDAQVERHAGRFKIVGAK